MHLWCNLCTYICVVDDLFDSQNVSQPYVVRNLEGLWYRNTTSKPPKEATPSTKSAGNPGIKKREAKSKLILLVDEYCKWSEANLKQVNLQLSIPLASSYVHSIGDTFGYT